MTSHHHLGPRHLEYLAARAISRDIARAAGLRSVLGAEAAELLGLDRPVRCGGLGIPYYAADGSVLSWRVRLDDPGDGPRYLAPRGAVQPYLPPAAVVAAETWTDPAQTICVAEAPVKALALSAAGWPCIGLGGVTAGGHDAEARRTDGTLRPHSELAARAALAGRAVTIIYDAGRALNPMVALGEAMLAAALAAGGAIVRVAALPLADGGRDRGPDDYLAAHGPAALRAVIDAAVPADPVARVRAVRELPDRDARADAAARLLADLPWVAAVYLGGAAVQDRAADELRRVAGIRVATLRERLAAYAAELRRRAQARPATDGATRPAAPEWRYHVHAGVLCAHHVTEGGEQHSPLATYTAQIIEEIERDDGAERTRRYVIAGALADGTQLPRAEIDAAEYAAMAWTAPHWGARAAIVAGPRARDQAREAIQRLSTPARRTVYAHTGWREIDGRPVDLDHGGAVGGAAVSVELQAPLDRYRLPEVAEDVPSAVRASLALLDCGPAEIMVPLLAAVYLAPLAEIVHPDLSIYMLGPSGALKSTLAALALNHYGATWDRLHLPCDWSATDNAIEIRLHLSKDVLCVVDDVAPQPDVRSRDELQRRVARILRSIGNRSARARLRADLSQRPDRPPRGLVIVTGEDLPPGASVVARTLVVPVKHELLNLDAITAAQSTAARLPHAMRGYLEWLAPQWDDLRAETARMWTDMRDRLRAAGASHLRHPEALAHLYVGLDVGLSHAVEAHAIEAARADEIRAMAWTALAGQAAEQAERQTDADPAERWIGALRALLAQGRVELVERGEPLDPAVRGMSLDHNREPIGWIDATHVLLHPEAVRARVARWMRDAGDTLGLSPRALGEALVRRGYVEPGPDGRPTLKLRCAPGDPVRVLRVPRRVLPAVSVPAGPRTLWPDPRSGDRPATDGEVM